MFSALAINTIELGVKTEQVTLSTQYLKPYKRPIHHIAYALDILTTIALLVIGAYATSIGLTPAAGFMMMGVGTGLGIWIVAGLATKIKADYAPKSFLISKNQCSNDV